MNVPFMDLGWQIRQVRGEIDAAIADCLDNTAFVQGKRVKAFEEEFACFTGQAHTVGCGSGTGALYLALKSVGVGPGDEVVLPTMTFFATAEAVEMLGAKPVLVDVEPETSTLDVEAVESALSARTKAVVPVLLYGRAAAMDRIQEATRDRSVAVVADAAQAHGAKFGGKPIGEWADVTCYSFYPGKNLGAFGDAGGCTTNDPKLARDMAMRRNHGREAKYSHTFMGVNMRMDEIQAAVLRVKLRQLADWTTRRAQLAERYDSLLAGVGDLVLPSLTANGGSVWHLYVVETERRDALQAALEQAGIGCGVHYPIPLHQQPGGAHLGYAQGAFPVAESKAARILSLPLFEGMSDEQQDRVVAAVGRVYSGS